MSDQNPFQGGPLTPEQLAALAKARTHDITYPVCLVLRCLGFGHLEDHLHQVHVFEMPDGQMAFGFGWCSASHVDADNFKPAELDVIRTIVTNVLEMKGFTVVNRNGALFVVREDGSLASIGIPGGGGVSPERIEAEVEKFRLDLDKTLGPPANKLPPDDPMSRWMP